MAHAWAVAWLFFVRKGMGHVFHGFVHWVVFLSSKVFSEKMGEEPPHSLKISLLFEIDDHSYHQQHYS